MAIKLVSHTVQVPPIQNPELHQTDMQTKLVPIYMASKFLIVCLVSYLVLSSLTELPNFSIFVVDLFFVYI